MNKEGSMSPQEVHHDSSILDSIEEELDKISEKEFRGMIVRLHK